MSSNLQVLRDHQVILRKCTRCSAMIGPPVVGNPVASPVLLVGQAPGPKEIDIRKPFAWTAGKTLFGWFSQIGLEEEVFRNRVYMAAVCRCFPGKNPKGGDRVPGKVEVENCSSWLKTEMMLLRPKLILPVGKLAIAQFLPVGKLAEVVGKKHHVTLASLSAEVVPLPHPSGASVWHRIEPGKTLLGKALRLIAQHPVWRQVCR